MHLFSVCKFLLFVSLLQLSQCLPNPTGSAYSGSNTYALDEGQAGADTVVGVGKVEGRVGPLYGAATGPEAGAHASGGLDKIGAGFRATAGEIEGRFGGVIGVGGKLGLSADSDVEIGRDGVKFHLLGTGASITGEKGFEVCFFGSCLSIG